VTTIALRKRERWIVGKREVREEESGRNIKYY